MEVTNLNKSRSDILNDIRKEYNQDIDIAVEVGTWRGDFAESMINKLSPKEFYAVDPYKIFEGMVSAPGNEYGNQQDLDVLAEKVKNRMTSLGGELLRDVSLNASKKFENNSIDVVYIDGDHTYEGVATDIKSWWPKVKPGGYLCGDDFVKGVTGKGFDYGVIEAVHDFVEQNNLHLFVYTNGQRQWLVRKNG